MVSRKSKEERINEITEAAIEVFLENGFENATMDAIAQRAGVSKGGLYHHFQSKDMILIMVNQKLAENVEQIIKKALQCSSVKEGMLYYIENYLRYWLEHPSETSFLFLSIAKVMDNEELLKHYQEFAVDYLKFFEEAFLMGVQTGEFVEHNVKMSAVTLMGALDGILSYLILNEDLELDDVVKYFEEKFIRPIENP